MTDTTVLLATIKDRISNSSERYDTKQSIELALEVMYELDMSLVENKPLDRNGELVESRLEQMEKSELFKLMYP